MIWHPSPSKKTCLQSLWVHGTSKAFQGDKRPFRAAKEAKQRVLLPEVYADARHACGPLLPPVKGRKLASHEQQHMFM